MKFELLGHGHVVLEESMGSDITIVNAARQSFAQKSDEMGKSEIGLINFLMKNRHGTPFEMVDFRFNIKCPIFVAREWMRHRIGSFNEMSGRYTKLNDEFYVPERENIRGQVGKPGAYTFETLSDREATEGLRLLRNHFSECWATYERLLEMGWAKELARTVLPVAIFTQFTWKVNLRSLLNFVNLRSDESAMYEIRSYSRLLENCIKEVSPIAYESFIKTGRVCP